MANSRSCKLSLAVNGRLGMRTPKWLSLWYVLDRKYLPPGKGEISHKSQNTITPLRRREVGTRLGSGRDIRAQTG